VPPGANIGKSNNSVGVPLLGAPTTA
jgi:hypothetical protein